MKGTIIKRGSKWSVVVDVGRDEDGKRIRKWHSGFDRKRDAEAARIEILSRLQKGNYVEPNKATLGEYLSRWLAGRSNLADTTKVSYQYDVRRVSTALGHRRLSDLQTIELAEFYRALLDDQALAPKTVRNVHAVVHRALKDAVRQGILARNPAEGIELPRPKRPDTEAWTADEVRRFLAHVRDRRLYAAWHLAIATGMRRSELLGLRWRNVDLDRHRLAAVDTLVMVGNAPTHRVDETKTTSSRRLIALDAATTDVLKRHRTQQLAERLAAGDAYEDHDFVFADALGRCVSPDWFTRTTKRLATDAGVPPLAPHQAARHTWATLALEGGVHPKVVADRLGHASVATTLDRYSHVIERTDRAAAELVAEAVFG